MNELVAIGGVFVGLATAIAKLWIWRRDRARIRLAYNMSRAVFGHAGHSQLAVLLTLSNPGGKPIYFGGFWALDSKGDIYYPSCSLSAGLKIEPHQYVQGAIPAQHLLRPRAKTLMAVDGLGKGYRVKRFGTLMKQISTEAQRLKSLGLE